MPVYGAFTILANESDQGRRLDAVVAAHLPGCSRSLAVNLISNHEVLVDNQAKKPGYRVKDGDKILGRIPAAVPTEYMPEAIPLQILYQDSHIVVINKQAGLVVHPAPGHSSGTLVNALLHHCLDLEGIGGEIRPGIVHRLDKDTSGVIITAKNPYTHEYLSTQFRKRKVRKIYLSIVKGLPQYSKHKIDTLITRDLKNRKRFAVSKNKGKRAVTEYEILRSYPNCTFLKMEPHTGRTHQLRVHAGSINCPILGDTIYSRTDSRYPDINLMLHAFKLYINLPGEDKIRMFRAPVPERFVDFFNSQKFIK